MNNQRKTKAQLIEELEQKTKEVDRLVEHTTRIESELQYVKANTIDKAFYENARDAYDSKTDALSNKVKKYKSNLISVVIIFVLYVVASIVL